MTSTYHFQTISSLQKVSHHSQCILKTLSNFFKFGILPSLNLAHIFLFLSCLFLGLFSYLKGNTIIGTFNGKVILYCIVLLLTGLEWSGLDWICKQVKHKNTEQSMDL